MKNVLLVISAVLLSHLASLAWADGDSQDGHRQRPIGGAYRAQLDLNPLDVERIETLGMVLHADGTVSYNSEIESFDSESAGIGVWKRLRGGQIGLGVLGFRVGDASGCAAIFGLVPPDNCILKAGATLDREEAGRLVGSVILTFETLDGVQFSLPPLPLTMEPLGLEDFPGALPAP